jgi:hypothetical protein
LGGPPLLRTENGTRRNWMASPFLGGRPNRPLNSTLSGHPRAVGGLFWGANQNRASGLYFRKQNNWSICRVYSLTMYNPQTAFSTLFGNWTHKSAAWIPRVGAHGPPHFTHSRTEVNFQISFNLFSTISSEQQDF